MPAYKDQKGKWYVKYKNTTKRGFKTKKEAMLYESQLRVELSDGNDNGLIMYYKLVDSFLDYTYNHVQYGTYDKKRNVLDNIIKPVFKNKRVVTITAIDCENLRTQVMKMNYSTAYKNYIIRVFKETFKYANRFYNIDHNPVKYLDNIPLSYEELLDKKEKEANIWTLEDFQRFSDYVRNPVYRLFYTVLYLTGMRVGEVQALTWNDFNENGSFLVVNKTYTRKTENRQYEIKQPKTISSIRNVLIDDSLKECLIRFKQEEMLENNYNDNWFIFGRNTPISQSILTKAKDRAIKKSGVKRIRIHDFRHSHASLLISEGCNIVAVSKRLGHSSIEMTLSKYTHLMEKNDKELVSKMNENSQYLLKSFSM